MRSGGSGQLRGGSLVGENLRHRGDSHRTGDASVVLCFAPLDFVLRTAAALVPLRTGTLLLWILFPSGRWHPLRGRPAWHPSGSSSLRDAVGSRGEQGQTMACPEPWPSASGVSISSLQLAGLPPAQHSRGSQLRRGCLSHGGEKPSRKQLKLPIWSSWPWRGGQRLADRVELYPHMRIAHASRL